ncbi:MAG TPA: type II secretion system F family protein [Solirubrobacteraceae bacterium]|jgi:tight adherence protein C
MTLLLFIAGVALVGTAVRLVIHAVVLPRVQISRHLRGIQGYGWEGAAPADDVDLRTRVNTVVTGFAERLGTSMMTRFPKITALRRQELAAAGYYDISPETVHGFRVIAALGLPVLAFLYVLVTVGLSPISVMIVVLAGVFGWLLPASVIRRRGRARLDQIDRDLPELIDLLTATVEAGMGMGASVAMVADRFDGALGDELRLTLKQQTLGNSNEQALSDMASRCDTPSVRAFVRTVTRGESMGVSIAPMLRELAVDVRRRRRHAAKEKMMKAPVKLLFPLMLLIFPALMVVILFPAGYTLAQNLSG